MGQSSRSSLPNSSHKVHGLDSRLRANKKELEPGNSRLSHNRESFFQIRARKKNEDR